jgi:hypothetical protein
LQRDFRKTPRNIELIRQIDRYTKDIDCKDDDHVFGLSFMSENDESYPLEYFHWLPSMNVEVARFLEFVDNNNLAAQVKSLVVLAHNELTETRSSLEDTLIHREVKALWREVFKPFWILNEITVVAPPSTMAALSGAGERDCDSWLFRIPYHYLRLTKDASSDNEEASSSPSSPGSRGRETFLYNMKAWNHLAYNEGTSLRGYGHYEYQWKRPPRILESLLLWLVKERMSPRTPRIQTVEYISSFPYASHVGRIASVLSRLGHIRRLQVKLADPDLLDDTELLGKAQPSDVYSEWEHCYANIVAQFLAKASDGTIFISSDTKFATLREQVQQRIEKQKLVEIPSLSLNVGEEDDMTIWTVDKGS